MKMLAVCVKAGLFLAVLMSPQIAGAQEDRPVKPIKELIAELKSSTDTAKKNEYLRMLTQAEPQTAHEKELVIDLIEDDDADTKCAAMEIMGKKKEKKATKKIIKNLKDKSDKVKITAAAVLGEIGDERAIDALLEDSELMVLEFGQCPVAKFGAAALPKLADLAARKSLLGLLPKQDKKNRRSRKAAVCISQIRDEKAVPDLMKMLKDSDDDIRLAAVGALAGMNIKEAEPEFEKMLNDKDFLIRSLVIRKMLDNNWQKYLPKAITILEKDTDEYVLSKIIGKLGQSKDVSFVPKLEILLKRGGEVGRSASVALRQITGKVYKYPKDSWIEGEELRRMEFINDEIKRFNVEQKWVETEKEKIVKGMGAKHYDYLINQQYNWELFKKRTLLNRLNSAHGEGYLLDFPTVDELLEELKQNPEKYDWRHVK